ncbi:MAG: NAD-dependent epimerase/dehydratase family protein [Bacteroidetes bacterium]|nr:MAG: NAD-dependent epimerase/dehydratase family protein [Bacteroidota bacterium]
MIYSQANFVLMILLTGANGLIGSYVARLFLEKNESFVALIRQNSDLSLLEDYKSKIKFVYGDILDIPSLENAFLGISEVVHCAAIVSFGDVSEDLMHKINIEGTANMVNMSLKHKISRFCMLSSIAAIGRDAKNDITDENAKWTESKLNSSYAKSKYLAELEVWRGIEEGLSAVMVCPSVVLGPGDWNKSSTKLFKNMYDGLLVYPSGTVNIVDVRDVAQSVWLTLKSTISGERYIISAHKVSYQTLLTEIATGFGKNPPKYKLNKNLALAGYYILRIFIPWILKKKFITKETIIISANDFKYDNQKFIKTFDYQYKYYSESIKWVCENVLKSK